MVLTEITFNELSKQVWNFEKQNRGTRPSFVIVHPEAYWNLKKLLYESGFNSFSVSFNPSERAMMKVRGVSIISSQELEKNQVEIVACSFRESSW